MMKWVAGLFQGGITAMKMPFKLFGAARSALRDDGNQGKPSQKKEHQMIVRSLRIRAKDAAALRQKQLADYKEFVKKKPPPPKKDPGASAKAPLHGFRTRVPFRLSKSGRDLLDQLAKKYPKALVIFPKDALADQKILIEMPDVPSVPVGATHLTVTRDPKLVHVKNQGVEVLAGEKGALVFRFQYPVTECRVRSRRHSNQGDLSYRVRSSIGKGK